VSVANRGGWSVRVGLAAPGIARRRSRRVCFGRMGQTRGMTFSFGELGKDGIEFEVVGHEGEPIAKYWDGAVLHFRVGVVAGGFRGEFNADVTAVDLSFFRTELESLFQIGGGRAELGKSDQQVHLTLTGVATGYNTEMVYQILGVVADRPAHSNKLGFLLELDVMQLRASLLELEKVVAAYPVKRK
jgi:hypothetical protein